MRDCLIWNELGTVYSKLGCLDEAMDAFHKAIDHDPAFGLSYSNLGWAYFCQGKIAEAISLYEKSLELLENDKEKAFTWDRLGEAYYQLGHFAKSANAYQKANELGSNHNKMVVGSSDPLSRQANSLSSLVPPSVPELDAEIEVRQTQDLVSNADVKKTESNPATNEIEPVEKPAPVDEVVVELESANAVSDACQDTPHEERPKTNGNGKYPISSRPDEVRPATRLPWLPIYMSAAPLSGVNLRNVFGQPTAVVQAVPVEEQNEESISEDDQIVGGEVQEDALSQAANNDPAAFPAEVWEEDLGQDGNELSAICLHRDATELKEIEKEIERFERTTSESPNNVRAWCKLGGYYKEVQRYQEAVHAFEQASSIEPMNPEYHYRLGQVYTALKEHEDAKLAYERTVELNPDDMLAHCALAGSYRHLGMDEKADEHVAIARPKIQEENDYNRACFEAIAGNVDKAMELLAISIENEQTTLEWISVDPDLDFIRADERFQALLHPDVATDLSE